ncbi:MAG: alpha/beta fold hydrolase [Deltaproteobacteria bacterium]|nr:alpha/beta fold hydrolase [Deltaproteobacteria bacterium]
MLKIVAYKKDVVADDGFALTVRDLHLKGHAQNEVPRAWMFHLVGSEPVSVTSAAAEYAEGIAQGFVVVLLQPRGVSGDGTVDLEVFQRYETRPRRVADQLAVMDAYLGDSGSIPVLLVGSSLGGVVAADVAARDARVSHLLMMASGCGWTQAEEMTFHLAHGQAPPGISTMEELDAKFAEIAASPDSGELWYGHPFRMWSSYLWFRPMDGLLPRPIPIFLAHGTADTATPVESARAMRDEFARLGLANLTYVEYPGLDHHFKSEAGESRLLDLQKDAYAWMAATGLPH